MKKKYYPEGNDSALESLIRFSREWGSDPQYVLAGGGNTSVKEGDRMFVKASGTQLGSIEADGFVEISLKELNTIWDRDYPADKELREEKVLEDLMDSRINKESRRPSVETLLHGLFPYRYVIHTHPALVNGITCSARGEEALRELFGEDPLWIPVIDPGYILARAVKDVADEAKERRGHFPKQVFLQNHGFFAAADTLEEIEEIYANLFDGIKGSLKKQPDLAEEKPDRKKEAACMESLKKALPDLTVLPFLNKELSERMASEKEFAPMKLSVTPDHIVYSGYRPLFCDASNLEKAVKDFTEKEGFPPRIVVVQGVGAFACQDSSSKAETAKSLFEDNLKIANYAESFGGIQFMPKVNIDFIRNWEVEKYRASMAK